MRKTLTLALAAGMAVCATAQTDYFTPYQPTALRAPSVPLIINDPYMSFWSPYDKLNDGTTRHWDNQEKGMDGLLRVDGKNYRFMGVKKSTSLEAIAPLGSKARWQAKVRYTKPVVDAWYAKDASETGWTNGYGGFGTKNEFDGVYTTWTGDNRDIYIRRHVTLTEEDLKTDLWVIYCHDDMFELYINGVKLAEMMKEPKWNENVKVKLTGEARSSLVVGDNVIAFHVHNTNGGSHADVGLYRNKLGFHKGYTAIAPMADEGAWEAKTTYNAPSGGWYNIDFNDEKWKTEPAAFGSPSEYPNINTSWTATNSDIYIRRYVTLTEADLRKSLKIIYSHDDVCQVYINGRRVVSTGNTWIQNVEYTLTDEDKAVLVEGENVIAYHVHNTTGGAQADIGLYADESGEILATQKACHVLATNTYYTFQCGPVDLDVVFTAPMLTDDLDLLSTPINFISYQVRANDGKEHDVQFYFGTTPELTVDNNMQKTISKVEEQGDIRYIKSGSVAQKLLGRTGDHITIDWGYLYIPDVNGTVSVNDATLMATTFATTGKLPEAQEVTSTEEGEMPALAYVHDFGTASTASSYLMVGYDEVKDIRYMDVDYKGYWARDGKTIQQAFEEYRAGYDDIMERCLKQDKLIYDDARASGNVKYAELLSLSYRHCIGAHKLFQDRKGNLLFFSKENDSNGCVNTVDLTYPSAPLFLIYNTDLMKGMCTSILEYCESSRWGFDFAAHDLGTYPHANNQVYSIRFPDANGGFAGNMPIEESGNIVILAAAISVIDGDMTWANKYWKTLKTWADYLAENGLDPENQLCTDDFAGHLAHNANLSIKAIMGVAGFALLCKENGDMESYESYMARAREMANSWVTLAKDGAHYKLAFDKSGTWSQKYNMVWDKVWNLGLFSDNVKKQEIQYYLTQMKAYGLPLDSREQYTKSDWISWTACLSTTATQWARFMDPLYKYANETSSRVPLSDWYWANNGTMRGFRARSVVGGHWMKVFMDKMLAGELTGINAARETQSLTGTADWYNLSGQRMQAEPTQPGIYIHGGRKVMKK